MYCERLRRVSDEPPHPRVYEGRQKSTKKTCPRRWRIQGCRGIACCIPPPEPVAPAAKNQIIGDGLVRGFFSGHNTCAPSLVLPMGTFFFFWPSLVKNAVPVVPVKTVRGTASSVLPSVWSSKPCPRSHWRADPMIQNVGKKKKMKKAKSRGAGRGC